MDLARQTDSEVGKLRGQAVHKAAHTLAMGATPTWSDETEAYIAPWLDGVRKFLREHEWQHLDHETEYICEEERFVSHPDWNGILDGKRTVIEIKTGLFPECVRLQTALQVIAIGDRSIRRVCLHLPGSANYKLTPINDLRDYNSAIILVRAWWIKQEYGVEE
jgi:hypothetical protein